MKKYITIDREALEKLVYDEVQKERHILFDVRAEDYFLIPCTIEKRYKGKKVIVITKEAWERHMEQLSVTLGDLTTARDLIERMKAVYEEYHEEYESKHGFDFDEYIKMSTASYDAEEFERVRERFEEEYDKHLFDDDWER
ncbi:MAG: hypothetical protein LUC99_06410 [Clostridiales bacterium]|nr:hypothetical protein [Clostridiales bacterium]